MDPARPVRPAGDVPDARARRDSPVDASLLRCCRGAAPAKCKSAPAASQGLRPARTICAKGVRHRVDDRPFDDGAARAAAAHAV